MSSGSSKRIEVPAYRQPAHDILTRFETDAQTGLNQGEASRRFKRYGSNELTSEIPLPEQNKFLSHFKDPLVILLVVATAISAALWFFERETVLPYEALAIFAVILLNVLLGYVQRSRAEKAVAALVRMAAAHADVLRDGMLQCALVASSVLWLRELSKFALRKLG